MNINKNHKNTTQFSWAMPYAANACISECSSELGTSALQASSALLTKQENFVEKPSLRLKKPGFWFSYNNNKPFSKDLSYSIANTNYHKLTINFRKLISLSIKLHKEKKWFFKRNALGFSDCVLLASQEALNGLGWAWKVYFSKPKMSQTAQGKALTKQKRGFLGFCLTL